MTGCRAFADLHGAHAGARICVMGAAPVLAGQLEQVRADLFISVNGHGAALREPAYVVGIDHNHSRLQVDMVDHIRRLTAAPLIGPQARAEIKLTQWPHSSSHGAFSGAVAVWVAQQLGAALVIVAGMDAHRGRTLPAWQPVARAVSCPVRVAGAGPLVHYWPAYRPEEEVAQAPLLMLG